jgi:hypothetical protein
MIDEVAHGAEMSGVFGESGRDRCFQGHSAMGIEELEQATGEHAQVYAALGGAHAQSLCTRCGLL